jgi:hypothetical protein
MNILKRIGRHPVMLTMIVLQLVFLACLRLLGIRTLDFNLYDTYYVVGFNFLWWILAASVIFMAVTVLKRSRKSKQD